LPSITLLDPIEKGELWGKGVTDEVWHETGKGSSGGEELKELVPRAKGVGSGGGGCRRKREV